MGVMRNNPILPTSCKIDLNIDVPIYTEPRGIHCTSVHSVRAHGIRYKASYRLIENSLLIRNDLFLPDTNTVLYLAEL